MPSKRTKDLNNNVASLKRGGFDKSERSEFGSGYIRVRCSQCVSMAVNGVAVHERGCPKERK